MYDTPATPFVYQFLGNVNAFKGNVHQGVAKIGDLEIVLDAHRNIDNTAATAFSRPHDIEVKRDHVAGSLKAKVTYIHSVGPAVRLELERDDDKTFVEAELTRARFDEINLLEGETVYLSPRNLRVFLA